MSQHSKLIRMRIANIGSIGPEGLEIALDNILCLVGENNSGKSTVLRAYELAVTGSSLKLEDICQWCGDNNPTVEIDVHIPEGMPNIDEKWKVVQGDLRLLRSKWEWSTSGGKPTRTTWNPEIGGYDPQSKAAGLDNVFYSRLPKPLRIGSLDNPESEHKSLLELIINPIVERIKSDLAEEGTEIHKARQEMLLRINKTVEHSNEVIQKAKTGIHSSYKRVFPRIDLDIKIGITDFNFDPGKDLLSGSSLKLLEGGNETSIKQQGTGSQRALFWSILNVRHNFLSELGKLAKLKAKRGKKVTESEGEQTIPQEATNIGLPGYMLLIDEPENALHPNAIRAARDFLYELSTDPQWQVMLSTHSPYFINPLENHTTIVRLDRQGNHTSPKTYKSDTISFSEDEKEALKMLLQMDTTVSEVFFGSYPIIVEGDTEYTAFQSILPQLNGQADNITILRARGKEIIPILIKMLNHFKIPFSVLHDIDAPKRKDGKTNSAWTANMRIKNAIDKARKTNNRVIHRLSIPDFEGHHFKTSFDKDKPWQTFKMLKESPEVQETVVSIFSELLPSGTSIECLCGNQDFEKWLHGLIDGGEVPPPDKAPIAIKAEPTSKGA